MVYNPIETIGPHVFEGASQLNYIQLDHNRIISLQQPFLKLHKLEELFLYSNLLRRIKKTTFRGLKRLKGLSLYNNNLVSIHKDAFKEIPKLKAVSMNVYFSEKCNSKIFREDPSKYWRAIKPYMTDKIKTSGQSISLFYENRVVNNPIDVCTIIFSMITS